MYTQCPECDVAFRVTAEVLKQAAGKVRCGGCGVAFNALANLSEELPAKPQRLKSEPDAPEFQYDEPGVLEADTPPKSISAAQSAALLKTLDQLAGEDIRIEDTGVEWRVLDPEDDDYDELIADITPTVAHEQMRFDDNTPLPDDFDQEDMAPQAPATEPVFHASERARSPDESQIDLVFGDPDEWEDLLGALDDAEVPEAVDEASDEASDEPADEPADEPSAEQPPDMDTQFAIQAEAMGIDLSGMHQRLHMEAAAEAAEESDTSIDDDLIAAAFEAEAATKASGIEDIAELDEEPAEDIEIVYAEQLEEESEEVDEADIEVEIEVEEADLLLEPEEDLEAALELALEDMIEDEDEFANELASFNPPEIIEVPELSEEEMTINMMIDKDLLAIAVEDDDGFTSTIVQKQLSSAGDIPRDKSRDRPRARIDNGVDTFETDDSDDETSETLAESPNPLFETIIMEGDEVHHDLDKARLAADRRAATASLRKAGFDADKDKRRPRQPRRYGMLGAAALLFIVLVLQVIHHSREAFATSPTFQKALGPLYRMVGSPVTPAWNINGWRFEATKGSSDEETQVLTIYSRVGNRSEQALPYPLVHVSLTDRFEEIIGSRVLDPAEYLSGDADPRRAIAAGESFDAVFTIASPSAEATGFKLNVCYRQSNGQLRCAVDDFK